MKKADAHQALLARLRLDLDNVSESQRQTQAGATHAENKQEGSKDMRSTEASYLARGLAQRVEELGEQIARLSAMAITESSGRPAAVGSLVMLQDDDDESLQGYLLTQHGGGARAEVDGIRVTAVTTKSPIGRALLGKREDDEIEFKTPKGLRSATVVSVV